MVETVAVLASRPARRRRDPLVPNQHGAWGFLLLPVPLGAAAGGWSWDLLPAVAAWVSLYPLSWALSGRLTAPRRRERFNRSLLIWSLVSAPLIVSSIIRDPWLIWVGLGYLAPFTANLWFAKSGSERGIVNDLILIAECTLAVPVVAGLPAGNGHWTPPWSAILDRDVALVALLCAVTLVGSTLHIKSLIRERANPRYAQASRILALLSPLVMLLAAGVAGRGFWLAAPLLLLTYRACFLRRTAWRPARLGLIELAGLVATAAVAQALGP